MMTISEYLTHRLLSPRSAATVYSHVCEVTQEALGAVNANENASAKHRRWEESYAAAYIAINKQYRAWLR